MSDPNRIVIYFSYRGRVGKFVVDKLSSLLYFYTSLSSINYRREGCNIYFSRRYFVVEKNVYFPPFKFSDDKNIYLSSMGGFSDKIYFLYNKEGMDEESPLV